MTVISPIHLNTCRLSILSSYKRKEQAGKPRLLG
jgi:hypothetical protein